MKAIIFDMDGVIFDTERVGDQAWRQAAEEMGFAQIDDAISQCRGLNRADTKAFFEREYPDLDYLAFHKRNHEIMNQLLADGMPDENRCGGTAPLAAAGGVACGSGNFYWSGEHHAPFGSGTHDRPV